MSLVSARECGLEGVGCLKHEKTELDTLKNVKPESLKREQLNLKHINTGTN